MRVLGLTERAPRRDLLTNDFTVSLRVWQRGCATNGWKVLLGLTGGTGGPDNPVLGLLNGRAYLSYWGNDVRGQRVVVPYANANAPDSGLPPPSLGLPPAGPCDWSVREIHGHTPGVGVGKAGRGSFRFPFAGGWGMVWRPGQPGSLRMKRVLLIDDDTELREALGAYLAQRGWEVHAAGDGDSGLEQARRLHPQVILCDMYMPCGNGFRVCSAIRQQPALQNAFVIAMSGNMFDDTRRNALDAGADEFMLKPLQPRPLLDLLERVTAQRSVPPSPAAPAPPPPADAAGPEGDGNFVRFWGVRGSIATPGPATNRYGGNTSCVEVRADGEIIILDAGTGIRPLGTELTREFKNQPLSLTILISHTHWDHVQGFPFFAPAYNPKNLIHIHGFEGAWKNLEGIFSGQMESPYFPIGLKQMPGNIVFEELREMEFRVGRVGAQAAFINHPGVTVGYRLNTSTGSVAFLPDHESCFRMRSLAGGGRVPAQPDELAFARREDEKTLHFLQGVDILIIDAQYDIEEYRERVGWGHSCVDDTVEMAVRAGAKKLFLFHHDPGHDDAKMDQMVAHARELAAWHGGKLDVAAAQEGLKVPLGAVK